MATEGPLCLDPSPVVSIIAAKAEHARRKFSTPPLRRQATKRYSQAGQNRKRKLESLAGPPELALHDFLRAREARESGRLAGTAAQPGKRKAGPVEALRQHREAAAAARAAEVAGPGTSWASGSLNLASPHLRLAVPPHSQVTRSPASNITLHRNTYQVDVQKYVREIAKRRETSDMTPQLVEEYILETAERGQARVYHTRLTILQRMANDEFIGELYVERDYREEDRKGSTCRFLLGTRTNALRYINQFTEIFTEEGRKNVKITHKVPNQQPRVTFTAGMRATLSAQQQAAQPSPAAASPGKKPVPAQVGIACTALHCSSQLQRCSDLGGSLHSFELV